jgi:hypothetical protein
MSDPIETPAQANRRRLINLGEVIALAALIISGLGLWNSWSNREAKPAVVVEKPRSIPLALRGKVGDDGKTLAISPTEAGHALESLTLTAAGKPPIELGSEPELAASSLQALIPAGRKEGTGTLKIEIDARFIEAGTPRRAKGQYQINYRWVGGGLFAGKTVRLTGFSRN